MLKIKKALLSVSDKYNLDTFAKGLVGLGVEIISTGGTATFLSSVGIKTKPIENVTGFPEILDGRLKTLHPRIHGSLLYLRENPKHQAEVKSYGIEPVDMVVVNLYPFQKKISTPSTKLEEALENIDIGGPAMIRSAAKNYKWVAVITNPQQYSEILKELNTSKGELCYETLAALAVEAFRLTGEYDNFIYSYLKDSLMPKAKETMASIFPQRLSLELEKIQDLRYGENQHQRAAFYKQHFSREASISNAKQVHGKELSYNNIMDMDAALEIVKDFNRPAAAIIKHANPAGVAEAETLNRAYVDALGCDKMSAFGGIVGFNREVDINTAEAILSSEFIECIIAPGFEKNALQRLMIKPNLRLLAVGPLNNYRNANEPDLRKVAGGILFQDRDLQDFDYSQLKIVTQKKPTAGEVEALIFAWKVVKHVRSNAIVLAQETKTVGIGAGQMSRVDSVFMAIYKAGRNAKGAVLASDGFFPKEDAIEIASREGITSIIQPGGSKADEKIIAFSNQKNISMVFTGVRHFKH